MISQFFSLLFWNIWLHHTGCNTGHHLSQWASCSLLWHIMAAAVWPLSALFLWLPVVGNGWGSNAVGKVSLGDLIIVYYSSLTSTEETAQETRRGPGDGIGEIAKWAFLSTNFSHCSLFLFLMIIKTALLLFHNKCSRSVCVSGGVHQKPTKLQNFKKTNEFCGSVYPPHSALLLLINIDQLSALV